MEKTYAYEQLLVEHKLTVAELPEDAQTGIKQIKDIEKAIVLSEKAQRKISPATLAKVKTFDKWVVREILDYVEGKETNTAAPAVAATTIIAEIKEETIPAATTVVETPVDPEGVKCDAEFAELLKNNKAELTLEELKTMAPTAYSFVFKHHTNDLTNGVTTSYYVLSETTTNNFKLVKK